MPRRVTKEGYEVIRSEGEEKPQLAEPDLILGWKEQFPIRFGYDHPNEIFAYLFQSGLARKINGEEPSVHPMTKKTMKWVR